MTLLNYIKFPIIVLISFILVGCGDERLPDSKNNENCSVLVQQIIMVV